MLSSGEHLLPVSSGLHKLQLTGWLSPWRAGNPEPPELEARVTTRHSGEPVIHRPQSLAQKTSAVWCNVGNRLWSMERLSEYHSSHPVRLCKFHCSSSHTDKPCYLLRVKALLFYVGSKWKYMTLLKAGGRGGWRNRFLLEKSTEVRQVPEGKAGEKRRT